MIQKSEPKKQLFADNIETDCVSNQHSEFNRRIADLEGKEERQDQQISSILQELRVLQRRLEFELPQSN